MRWAGLLLIAAVACGGDSGPIAEMGEDVCADLRRGHSMFQVARSGLNAGLSRSQVQSAFTLGIEDHCPEFWDDYKKTAIYRDW